MEDALEELAALYALDLLEGADKADFERQLAARPALRAAVDRYREAAALLAHTLPPATPPADLRSRLLREIEPAPGNVLAFPGWMPWSIAAGFAVATLWLGGLYWSARTSDRLHDQEAALAQATLRMAGNQREAERIVTRAQLAALEQKAGEAARSLAALEARSADASRALAAAQGQIASLSQRLQSEANLAQLKIATLTSMLGNSPQALAVAVWNPAQQEGIFSVQKMPAAGDDRDYELWVFAENSPTPIAAGVFAVGAGGEARVAIRPESPVPAVAKFAVTRERKGGVPPHSGPQGELVMASP